MAEPSGVRNFFGRVVDRILPGSNYDASTGQYSNIGTGIAGAGAKIAASAFLGPLAGQAVGKVAGNLIDYGTVLKPGQQYFQGQANDITADSNAALSDALNARFNLGTSSPYYLGNGGAVNAPANLGLGQSYVAPWQSNAINPQNSANVNQWGVDQAQGILDRMGGWTSGGGASSGGQAFSAGANTALTGLAAQDFVRQGQLAQNLRGPEVRRPGIQTNYRR